MFERAVDTAGRPCIERRYPAVLGRRAGRKRLRAPESALRVTGAS
jgi:hypothetical protein